MTKEYKYYACYKDSHGNGENIEKERYAALKQFECYLQEDIVFLGVIKCTGNNPLSHICHLN